MNAQTDEKLEFTNKQKEFAEALLQQNPLYIIIDKTTNMPYVDEENRLYLFSSREYAEECVDYYAQQLRQWFVGEIPQDKIVLLLGSCFYYAGAAGVVVDNGQAGTTLAAEYLVQKPDMSGVPKEQQPVTNPNFFLALIQFLQEYHWQTNYPDKAKQLRAREEAMIKAFAELRLLVPAKMNEDASMLTFATMDGSNNFPLTPAFTDWGEFDKVYDRNEWNCLVISADDLKSLSTDAIVINPASLAFIMSKKMAEQMLEICKET